MSYEDRRDPNYSPQYMREPSIRPRNHQISRSSWFSPCFWFGAWAQAFQDVAEIADYARSPDSFRDEDDDAR